MSDQANLFFRNNQNLFSNNCLDYRLPETDLWKGQKGNANGKREAPAEYNRAVGKPVAGGKEGKVSGEHPGAGTRIHGVRGRTRKPQDAEGAHEEFEEYNPSSRSTRYIESGTILGWVESELSAKRNDTVHDFLAYLAEQMIELNKAKNEEAKGFLKWLEREIGAEIDTLTNKTAIKVYHDHDFNHLIDVLKKNKNKLSADPSNRKTQELLKLSRNKFVPHESFTN